MKTFQTKQREFDYCMYMMLTSYFKKAVCETKMQEQKLFLYYREMKASEQICTEVRCEELIENCIVRKIPKELFGCSVRVHLMGHVADPRTTMRLDTGTHVVLIRAAYHPKYPDVEVQVLRKLSS